MKVITDADLQKDLASVLDSVIDEQTPVLVTRPDNKMAVLISVDDFNAFEETAYLLKSPENAKRLRESIAQIKAGKTSNRDLIEE